MSAPRRSPLAAPHDSLSSALGVSRRATPLVACHQPPFARSTEYLPTHHSRIGIVRQQARSLAAGVAMVAWRPLDAAMVSPKSEAGREFASRHGQCIAVVAISDGDQYSAHAAACSMMVSFMSDDRRMFMEMLKPAVPQAAYTKLLVDFFLLCTEYQIAY